MPGFPERPVLLFWEMTRACPLSCAHCRASAIPQRLPGELTTEEGRTLIDRLLDFGRPPPTLVLTGGDPLERPDLFDLIDHARGRGLHVAVSPAVSERLDARTFARFREAGVSALSISLDGARAAVHDRVRGVPGIFDRSLEVLATALREELRVQVNSTVMAGNAAEFARLFDLVRSRGVRTWEVFFLIRTGRGSDLSELAPSEAEDVGHFLYEASRRGVLVRPVEAPFVRRILRQRQADDAYEGGPLYRSLRGELEERLGSGVGASSLSPKGTLDGDGILFVAYDGTVYPGGFLPEPLGNVRRDDPVDLYRRSELLVRIRDRALNGACGRCPYRFDCGGSRARAFAHSHDALASDPACPLTAAPAVAA